MTLLGDRGGTLGARYQYRGGRMTPLPLDAGGHDPVGRAFQAAMPIWPAHPEGMERRPLVSLGGLGETPEFIAASLNPDRSMPSCPAGYVLIDADQDQAGATLVNGAAGVYFARCMRADIFADPGKSKTEPVLPPGVEPTTSPTWDPFRWVRDMAAKLGTGALLLGGGLLALYLFKPAPTVMLARANPRGRR